VDSHVLRRVVHILGLQATLIYYAIPDEIFYSPLDKNYAMLIALLCVFEFEYIRITRNWNIPGIRPYEKYRFSAVFWASLGLFICYLLCPYFVGIPVVLGAAWVDPLMGELRRKNFRFPFIPGFAAYFLILFLALLFLSPFQPIPIIFLSLVASSVAILCECWKNYYLDDNFLMLTLPPIAAMVIIVFLM